jgi:putative transposase
LHTKTEAWTQRQEKINYLKTSKLLTQWKQEEDLQFLNDVSAVPLQQCLRHLEKAFGNFWAGRARYPRFKRKRSGGSAEFTKSAFRWQDGELWLAKTQAPLHIIWSRALPDCEPSTITVRVDAAGHWYVSLLVDNLEIKSLPTCDRAIGLDVGITDLVTTSNGDKIPNPKHFNKYHRKLRNAQKKLSRKQKTSRNREKARRKVAKIPTVEMTICTN